MPAPPVSGLKKRESPAQTRVPQWGTSPSKARILFKHSHLVYTRALPGPTPFVTRSAPRPRGGGRGERVQTGRPGLAEVGVKDGRRPAAVTPGLR